MNTSMPYGQDNIGIYGYGSLLTHAGERLEHRVIARIPAPSPWPIEYARRSVLWGGGPTLVLHPRGGTVQGQILVLNAVAEDLGYIRKCLREREGHPPDSWIRETRLGEFDHVFYCNLEPTLGESEIKAEKLASYAIESVRKQPGKNGIRYLRQNIEANIVTPLTYAYRNEILRQSGAKDLLEAEEVLLQGTD